MKPEARTYYSQFCINTSRGVGKQLGRVATIRAAMHNSSALIKLQTARVTPPLSPQLSGGRGWVGYDPLPLHFTRRPPHLPETPPLRDPALCSFPACTGPPKQSPAAPGRCLAFCRQAVVDPGSSQPPSLAGKSTREWGTTQPYP